MLRWRSKISGPRLQGVIRYRGDPAASPGMSGYDPKAEVKTEHWYLPRWAFAGLVARCISTRIEQDRPIRGKDEKVMARLIHDIRNVQRGR
jgi:hypothetical protein